MMDDEEKSVVAPRSRWLSFSIMIGKTTVSVSLIWYFMSRYAPGRGRFASIDLHWCLLALLALFATIPLGSERWRRIVAHYGGQPTWSVVFRIFYTSAFFTQVLPSIGGDLVRIIYHRQLNSTIRELVISVLLDRGMGIAGLLVLTLWSYPLLSGLNHGSDVTFPAELLALTLLVAAGVGALTLPVFRGHPVWKQLPSTIRESIDGMAWAVGSREGLSRLLPLSVLVQLLSVLAIYAIGRSLDLPLNFQTALGVAPLILLAQVLPISIGGWGVRETAAVALLTKLGFDAESSLTLSIIYGVLVILATLPGLLCWFSLRE